jgi:hypothetical protein
MIGAWGSIAEISIFSLPIHVSGPYTWPGFGLFLADPTLYQLSRGCQLLHTEAFQVLILAYTRHIKPFFTLGFTRHFRQPHLDQM